MWGIAGAFAMGAITALVAAQQICRALDRAARRQRESDRAEMDRMQHSLHRLSTRCQAAECEARKRQIQAAYQAGVIRATGDANRRVIAQEYLVDGRCRWE